MADFTLLNRKLAEAKAARDSFEPGTNIYKKMDRRVREIAEETRLLGLEKKR